jgi:hypothetical protein
MTSSKIRFAAVAAGVVFASLWGTSLTLASSREGRRAASPAAGATRRTTGLSRAGWSAPVSMDPAAFLANSVSCPSQSFCVTDGASSYRAFNGKGWSSPAPVPGARGLTGVSCSTISFCTAVDGAGQAFAFTSLNGGPANTWGPAQTVDRSGGLVSVSCPESSFCMAIDSHGNAVAFNGRWGAPQKVDGHGTLVSVSCASGRLCVAVDSVGNAVLYQGRWGSPKRIDSKGALTSVSCEPNSSACDAVDNHGNVVALTGGRWHAPQSIDPMGLGLYGIGCTISPARKLLCAATDGKGEPVEQIKGKWYIRPIHTYGGLNSVSCAPNALFCIAVGGGGGSLEFNNYSWTPINVGEGVSWASCVSSAFCAAVDFGGHVVFDQHGKWGVPQTIDPGGSLTSISCASTRFCAAVDKRGRAMMRIGTKWTAPKAIDAGGGGLNSVACAPGSTFCAAVDTNDRALIYKSGQWGRPRKIDKGGGTPNFGLNSVSCPTVKFCATVNEHDGITYNGTAWGEPHRVDPLGGFMAAVSCSSAKFCMEVDFEGDDHTYNNGTWSPPRGPNVGGEFNSVSCRSGTFCVGVGLHDYLRYKGGKGPGSWTTAAPVDRAGVFSAVSCVSTSYCLAVDQGARALILR